MPYDIPKTVSKIYVHTGNVLNANELTQKAGKNATEEVTIITKFILIYLNNIIYLTHFLYLILGS